MLQHYFSPIRRRLLVLAPPTEMNTAVAHTSVPAKVVAGAAALALSSLLLFYRRRRRSAPAGAASPAAPAAPTPAKAPPRRETLTVELREPRSKTRPVRPGSAAQAADWPRLSEARGGLGRDLAMTEATGAESQLAEA